MIPKQKDGESLTQFRIRVASELKPIDGIEPLKVDESNFVKIGNTYYNHLMKLFRNDKRGICSVLGNRKVYMTPKLKNHLFAKKEEQRSSNDVMRRIEVMPFIPAIIEGDENTTAIAGIRENKYNSQNRDYELISKVNLNGEESIVSVILTDGKPVKGEQSVLYISVFRTKIKTAERETDGWLRKSATGVAGWVCFPCMEAWKVPQDSSLSGKESSSTGTSLLCCQNNHKYHIPESGESQVLLKGKAEKEVERPAYKMLEDVQDGLCRHFTMTLNVIYKTLCRYLGLPEVSETMLKARDNEEEPLILNGRVIFSPETGEPLKNRDWQRLINAIEKYIGRKMSDQDQRLVMQNAAVAKIISHLLKNNTREAIEKLRLESVDKKVGFYRATESWKRLKEAFPDLSAADIDRLELARDNVGNYISSVGADVVKKIKEVYYQAVTGKKDKGAISQELFDWFGDLNRNYERIVKTESNNITNRELIREGLRGAADGEPVYFKRYEGSANICPFCRDANGVIARWSDKPMEDERCDDGIASVWIWDGKTNYGRNRAQWWYSAESFHPNCQGIWERYYP